MNRFTYRNATGVSLNPGANLVDAMEALCIYEDLCQLAGCDGLDELENLLGNLRKNISEKARNSWRKRPPARILDYQNAEDLPPSPLRIVRHCEECAFWEQSDGRMGLCKRYPKQIHPTGTKFGKMEKVPGEFRPAAARRVACIKGFIERVKQARQEDPHTSLPGDKEVIT